MSGFICMDKRARFYRRLRRISNCLAVRVPLFISLMAQPVYAATRAAGDSFEVTVNITATVVAEGNCKFNSSNQQTVEFGDVTFEAVGLGQYDVKGEYIRVLPSVMTCTGDLSGTTMSLTSPNSYGDYGGVRGIRVSYTNTFDSPLGIGLLVDGVSTPIAEPFLVNMSAPPKIQVKLLHRVAGNYSSGYFPNREFMADAVLTLAFS